MTWLLADAKHRFSEVVSLALTEGPQLVRRRQQAVVVMAEVEYQRLTAAVPSFKQYLSEGPSFEELDLVRDPSSMRDVSL